MIIDFSFGNFRSFKDIQSLNMSAAKINELAATNTFSIDDKLSLLKSKAIYGANASGKSNLIKAMVVFRGIVISSVKNNESLTTIISFLLSEETENKPSFFQLIFMLEDTQYRYGFEATGEKIMSEWLYGTPNQREVVFFIREENKIIDISGKHFKEGKKILSFFNSEIEEEDNEIFRSNSLFLSALGAVNARLSKKIIRKINSISVLSGLSDRKLFNTTGAALNNVEERNKITDFLKLADTGVNSIDLVELSEEVIDETSDELKELDIGGKLGFVISTHSKYSVAQKKMEDQVLPFRITQSKGTIKMFELSYVIIKTLEEGRTIFIDEFDARLHPLIIKKIVALFNSEENKTAQLVFVTHSTNLLSHQLLRRDQIEFVEKDKYGASHLYSLVQFKGIRNNASFEKDYINGKYGAIPFLGDFNTLLNLTEDA